MNAHPPRGRAESLTGPSPADAAQEIASFGSAVVRDIWAPEHLQTLRDAVVGFSARRAELIAAGGLDSLMRRYHEAGSVVWNWLVFDGRIEPDFLSDMFRGSFFHEICREFFQDEHFYVTPERIGFRNLRPPHSDMSALPFHQDSHEQDRRILRVLNCWIPLDPGAGTTSPGVEVLRDPGKPRFELRGGAPTNSVYDGVAIDRDRIVAEYGEDRFWAPSFDVGDGFVFSEHVIHRTYVTPQMDQPRIGFEFRVFSMKHLASWASAEDVEAESFQLV